MKKVAAFFDIDGTVYREGLITEVFKKLVKYEIIQGEKWYNEVRPEFVRWDKRQGDYDNYLLKMVDIYMDAIKGLKKDQIDFIAKRVVEQKGDFRGSIYVQDEHNMYTGDVIPMWDSESKQKAINELVKLYDIELDKSYAYGDTAGDYTMLNMVGNPYCMNPTKELLGKVINDESLKKKVNVIVERKDVTYNLDVNNLQFA